MAKYIGQFPVETVDTTDATVAAEYALKYILKYGQIDGEHHKLWVLDQVTRILLGTPVIVTMAKWDNGKEEKRFRSGEPSQRYLKWVDKSLGDLYEDGSREYEYDKGIAP